MLQKKGVPAVGLRPGDGQQFGVPIGILEPRDFGHDEGLKLHGIQMPPAPILVTLNMQTLLGLRIGLDGLLTLDLDLHALCFDIHPHVLDLPRRLNS
jgi:hypothetical protein